MIWLALVCTLVTLPQVAAVGRATARSSAMWRIPLPAPAWIVFLLLGGVFMHLALLALRSAPVRAVLEDAARTMEPVKDPVCGQLVYRAAAVGEASYQGRTYYFSSTECLRRFEGEPELYVGRAPMSIGNWAVDAVEYDRNEPRYTTWGRISLLNFGGAGSGGLEYERLPEVRRER